jgi:hypothetical protein
MKTFLPILTIFLTLACEPAHSQSANRVDIGKSFANISKMKAGGTYNPGDTIEIRVTIAVLKQTTYTAIDSVQVMDTVPAFCTYITGSMRVATNEGITYKGPFTEASDSDPGKNIGGFIVINLGNKANGTKGGRIRSDTSRPSLFNSHCIMMACYKVRINAAANYGDTIKVGGSIRYKMVTPATGWVTQVFQKYPLLLFANGGFCPNGSDVSAASDNNGTFGTGKAVDRLLPLSFATSYIKQNIGTGQPQDYYYAIVKNSSANSWTDPNASLPDATRRVFGLWDIAGDHTNAANSTFGNAPPASTDPAGYFVLINASYNTNVAYQETLSNLCPNTYYEFSAWFRNVCPRCSCDSTGKGSGTSGFITGPGNDSSGVKPNLNFEIDGLAYYTTGDMKYDRGGPWKKYGFTFLTKATQTTAKFAIRNNSPGGGGNDWAIDDIKVSHCGPSLTMNYTPEVIGCKEGAYTVALKDTIRFIYNSYVHFKWQKSNVGGTVWTDMTGAGTSGVGSPTLVNGLYQYVTSLPPFLAYAADSGTYYRVVVATTLANLANNCSFKDQATTMVRSITCGIVLQTKILMFKGILMAKKATLNWYSTNEENLAYYSVEKSLDGIAFSTIGKLYAQHLQDAQYSFSDPDNINGQAFYRLKLVQQENIFLYSKIIALGSNELFSVNTIQNPFTDHINLMLNVPESGMVNLLLFNDKGQKVKTYSRGMIKGTNQISLTDLENINKGAYYISLEYKNEMYRQKLMKW